MKKYSSKFKTQRKQEGVALAIGIILLLIISLLGINSMKSALLQEKMAAGLTNRNYADAAAYTLLISVESFMARTFENNNGASGNVCDPYCGNDPRSNEWHSFISNKDMTDGLNFPGASSHLAPIMPYLHDEPRYVLYRAENAAQGTDGQHTGSSSGNFGVTQGEEDGGAVGGTTGNGGESSSEAEIDIYRIGSKANDKTGNYYVVYESIYAIQAK